MSGTTEFEKSPTEKSAAFKISWPSFERLNGAAKLLFQTSTAVGGIFLLIYCGEVGHYPVGVTLADVLLLIAMAIAPTALYSIFFIILYGAGLALVPVLRPIFNFLLRRTYARRQETDAALQKVPAKQIPPLEFSELAFGIFGFLFSIVLALIDWTRDPWVLPRLIGYIVIVAILRMGYSLRRQEGENGYRSNRDLAIVLGMLIYIFPLVGGLFAPLNIIPSSVRLIGVRKESATVFVSNSRAALIEAERVKEAKPTDIFGDYHRYEKAIVAIHGIGTETVVEIEGRRWVIPNDQLVISYQPPKP